jgi:hypothetical protein
MTSRDTIAETWHTYQDNFVAKRYLALHVFIHSLMHVHSKHEKHGVYSKNIYARNAVVLTAYDSSFSLAQQYNIYELVKCDSSLIGLISLDDGCVVRRTVVNIVVDTVFSARWASYLRPWSWVLSKTKGLKSFVPNSCPSRVPTTGPLAH